MTAQQPDNLRLDGADWLLLDTPLDRHPAMTDVRFLSTNTGNWRGYVADWEIVDERLVLTAIRGTQEVNEIHVGLSGRILVTPGRTSVRMNDCRGLVFAAPQSGPLPVTPAAATGRWFVNRGGSSAVRVEDEALATGLANHQEGSLICGISKVKLAKATIVEGAQIASAVDLPSMTVDIGADVVPTPDGWYPLDAEVWHGFHGYPEEPVAGSGWARESIPPPPVPPGAAPWAQWWPVENLVVRSAAIREVTLDTLGEDPLPLAAHWVTGTLRAGRGPVRDYVHRSFESTHADEIAIDVVDGRVTGMRSLGSRY